METPTIIVILAYYLGMYLGMYLGFRWGKYEEYKKRIDEVNKLKVKKPTMIHKNWSKK